MNISTNYQLNSFTPHNRQVNFNARISTPVNMPKHIVDDILSGNISKHFVPTPTEVIDRMIAEAGLIKATDRLLEPSAGYGHIADRVALKTPLTPNKIDVIEPVEDLRRVLFSKGYNMVDYDILKYNPGFKYDVILMNPPFDNGSDILHLVHCFNLLKKGGRLVSILPENDFLPLRQPGYEKWMKDWLGNGQKKEINEYLFDMLRENDSKTVKLGKVFKKSDVPDDVDTRMVIIKKAN